MKKLFYCFIIFTSFLLVTSVHAQWVKYYSGATNGLNDVYFINSRTGWVSSVGYILKTTDGAVTWTQQSINPLATYIGIYFNDYNTGYTTAFYNNYNYIFKTTNSGTIWNNYPLNVVGGLNKILFINFNTGWAVGLGKIYYTSNAGSNWILQYNSGISSWDLRSLQFINQNTGWTSGIAPFLKTTNGGLNWVTICNDELWDFYMFNENSGCGIKSGLMAKTSNGGVNWTLQSAPGNNNYRLAFISLNTGFAAGANGIYKTTNGGNNWLVDTLTGLLTSVFFYSNKVGYAVAGNGDVWKNTYFEAKLNNITKTIGRNANTTITLNDSLCMGIFDSVYWYVNDSLVSRQHSMTYNYKQGTSLVKLKISNNSGQIDSTTSWITACVYKKYTGGQILAGESLIGDSVFYSVSTGNAVYKMDINGNFIYPLVTGGSILSECSISYDTCVYITSTDANLYGFKSDGSNIWPAIPLGGQASTTPTIDSASNRLYIGVANGFFRAINRINGTSAWSYFCDAPVKSSAVISSNRKLVVASSAGTVYGFNLNLPSPSPPAWTLSLGDSILVSPAIDSLGYYYFGSRSGKVYKLSLTGTNTISIVWQQPLGSAVTSSPVIDANNNIYVGTENGRIYCLNSGNGSVKWNFQTGSTIRSTPVITPKARIYFGNDNGEVYGIDTNMNLKFYFIDTAKVSCSMLYSKGTLYFGNESGRLYSFYDSSAGVNEKIGKGVPIWGTFQNNPRRTGNQRDGGQTIGVEKISEIIPDKFELYQNYPNPFNPVTNIKYQISKNSFVVLKIYDILGREVQTLVNEKQSPGIYSVDFDGTMLASGVYFYKITAGDFTEIKKMVLIK